MMRFFISLIALCGLSAPAVAQDAPPPPVEADDVGDVDDAAGEDAPEAEDAAGEDAPEADDAAEADDADQRDAANAGAPAATDPDAEKDVAEDDGDADKDDKDEADDDADDEGDADDAGDVDDEPAPKPDRSTRAKAADPLTAFREKAYAKARDGYLERLDERPAAPALHYRVAVSAALADDPAVAEKHAATVERLDPGNLKALELAAAARVARTRANPPTVALAEAERALRDGRLRSAIRLATAALRAEGADAGALHRVRGEALLALGRADESMDALQSAAAAGHTDARLWLALGDAAKSVGDKARAAYLYTLAAQSAAPSDPVVDAAAKRRKRLGKTRRR